MQAEPPLARRAYKVTTRDDRLRIHPSVPKDAENKKKAPITEPFEGPARGGRMSR